LYLVFNDRIDFFTLDTVGPRGCELSKVFSLENFARILTFAFSHQIAVTIGPAKALSAYSFDDFGRHFIPLPSHQSIQEITHVAVLDDGIVYATALGNLCRVELAYPVDGGNPEFRVTESFAIGGTVTALAASGSDLLIGMESGMVARLRPLAVTPRFVDLYGLLAKKVTSLGRLQKSIERLARFGKYYTTRRDVCDAAVLHAYLRLAADEKPVVLADTDFAVDEAESMIRAVTAVCV
jgi:hypothetical protein